MHQTNQNTRTPEDKIEYKRTQKNYYGKELHLGNNMSKINIYIGGGKSIKAK